MTAGHQLWKLLQAPRYVRDGPEPFDWWSQLKAERREQYEEAAKAMILPLPSEQAKANAFMAEHRQKHGQKDGSIGGRFTFCFTGTSIGMVCTVKCACGDECDVTEV